MKTRIFTLLVAFLATLSGAVWGQSGTGNFTVEPSSSATEYDSKRQELTITSNATISNSEATEDVLIIDGGSTDKPLEITLNGININRTNKSPNVPAIKITSGSYVKFTLQNENSIATNTEQGTDATTGVITLEQTENDNPTTLIITGTGELNITANSNINAIAGKAAIINIENGTIKTNSGIGGLESTVTVSGGNITIDDEKGCTACIGNGKSVSISGESTNITLKNPSVGIDADDIDIVESEINITYGADYTKSGTGIKYSKSLKMNNSEYTVKDEGNITLTRGATGISASAGTAEISNCKMDMLVRDGIDIKGNLSIKETKININALHDPIVATSTEVSTNSILSLKSTKTTGGYPGISGKLSVDGSSYIIADSDSDAKTDTNYGIEEKDRGNWTGIVLESTNIDDFVSGYVYGNVTLGSDFELKENDQLVYSEPTNLEFGQYNIINNGSVCIANEYEDKGIEERIDKGNGTGTYYYQIFFEDDGLEIPSGLQDKMNRNGHAIGDILISMDDESKATTDLVHRKVHPQNSNQESGNMVFGKSQESIKLGINSDLRNISNNQKPYDKGYVVKSFDVKTMDGNVIAEGVTSFNMPDEAVVICNLKIEGAYKLTYELVGEDTEGLKVQFKDQKQNIIESAAYDDLVFIFISAPGYENFSVSEVSAKYTETGTSIDNSVFDATYADDNYVVKAFDSMPKGDVTITITGKASNPIPYKVSIDENIQNGEVTATKEDGTDATDAATTIYYENKIIVSATPNDGYELKSLKYINETTKEEVEIAYNEEAKEYSFSMPASNVTITAVFELPKSPEDPDDGDDEQGGIVPDYPKYYNIYEEEICEGVTVEFSRDVVKEGQSVLVTVKVDEEFDATDLTLKFKRALFGYWEDLTLTPTENPGEYIIKNIYTDIYVRAEGAVPTGIEDIEGAKVYTKDGSIYVYTPTEEQVTIISISGAVLKNEQQIGLKQYTGLQRGIYIICIDEARFKVRL